ncbi:MAG TPA: hypothetical protein DCZ97_12220 [Syntrophus sp. (in: bacteria)]|nr:hypothetical protein [Syntrophus sp. (in: bacteria)]
MRLARHGSGWLGADWSKSLISTEGRGDKGWQCNMASLKVYYDLGSVGSVIPIFRRQLMTTGKLTVTHKDASHCFMLIPEAAGLILQAGAMGE